MSTTYAMRPLNIDRFRAILKECDMKLERHPDAKPEDTGWYGVDTPSGYVHVYAYTTPVRKLERVNSFERFGSNSAQDVCDALDAAGIEWASEHDEDYERLLGRCA